MTTSAKAKPSHDEKAKPSHDDEDRLPQDSGPTAPSTADDKSREPPKTGGYDDHSPNDAPSNEKGGYGTG